jgi:hypothetical protein
MALDIFINTLFNICLLSIQTKKADSNTRPTTTLSFKLLNDFWTGLIIGFLFLPLYLAFCIQETYR